MTWTPDAFRAYPIAQQPTYDDPTAVADAVARLRSLPPLVAPGEIRTLRKRLARVARGEAFLLQGGDCAETFEDCRERPIEDKLKILLQMSLVLTWGARVPVVRLGRLAGQYSKPRSSDTETVGGLTVPSYRGDHVNGHEVAERRPDPERLVSAYYHAAATLNYVRALLDGGFADLHEPSHWDLDFVVQEERRARYASIRDRMLDALDFVRATGGSHDAALRSVELYASHEGLLLEYEAALTRFADGAWYDLSAHLLWIGHRTRQVDGAHVAFFGGVENPIGVKVGPGLEADQLVNLLDRIDPTRTAGRVVLYSRFGAGKAADALPPLIDAVRAAGHPVVWSCDPMHGNTQTVGLRKTRRLADILTELGEVLDIHEQMGSRLGGVHLELTGDDVTECLGGPQELQEADLERSYQTRCDPRLNYAQALEVAYLLADRLGRRKG